MTALEERWRRVLDGMSEAERHASRPAGSVRLVAVSKFHPASDIAELCRLGQRDFGENYVQEARAKQQELADLDIRWHAIGAVQSNKAKDVAEKAKKKEEEEAKAAEPPKPTTEELLTEILEEIKKK